MRKLTKLLSALIVLVLATAFIGCGNPSSSDNGGGNSNSPTYTTVAGGTYLYSTASRTTGYVFNADNSVSGVSPSATIFELEDYKWRIVDGYTVQIYEEDEDGLEMLIYTFTANSGFTQLTIEDRVYNRQ